MRRLLAIYRAHLRVSIVQHLTYRLELVLSLSSMVLNPVVFVVVWQAAARQGGAGMADFSAPEVAAYFVAVMLVNHLTLAWSMWEWEGRVRMGTLSELLLRPYAVIHRDIAENLAFKAVTLPVMVATAVAMSFAFAPRFELKAWSTVAFVPALVLAYALRFTIDWTVALAAFFVTRVAAINRLYFLALLLLSGQAAPLSMMPLPVRAVASVLPFRWMLEFPVELVLGRLRPGGALAGLGAQAGWLVVATAARRTVWRSGLDRYTGVGL